MAEVTRFGVSIEKDLIDKFDKAIKKENYSNRSEAIRDLIREKFVKEEWTTGGDVAGTITVIYDHHRRDLVNKLIDIQHDTHDLIVSGQHIHLDHHNCMEIIVVRGQAEKAKQLADKLRSVKGVKFGQLSMASTGKNLI
ncbi:MAG TPA: nickel-responsive transcriptional regulator NikR [Candidatus Omnitrophota bacterium]|nr:nickel-responsive transcriptional regulator NikR [Candidatus Omnitrophota bacterium]HPS20943.1 nickel-responsive transcriptional regulator NikR [Candidatus Omnitrophota bacterium]